MFLRSLQLTQFRCFEGLRLDLPPGLTLFHGDNAQGKTSILEAACVLTRLQSPRSSVLGDCVRFGEKAFAVGGVLVNEEVSAELRLQFRESGRRLLVDGENQSRGTDYLRHSARVVWMANDDLALVRGGGEGRRRYLDFMAGQLYPEYRDALKNYERALRSRNFLLKRDSSPRWSEIAPYTRLLQDHGMILTKARRSLIEQLQPHAAGAQAHIAGSSESLMLSYEAASGEGDELAAHLDAIRPEEQRKRQTLAGPHRDDLALFVEGKPAGKFASEGQQRTIALALKLGQAQLFLATGGPPPLILIDDVFGELDPRRRNALMSAWPKESQKLITTTHLNWLDDSCADGHRLTVAGAAVSAG